MKNKLTPKQMVLRKSPMAYCSGSFRKGQWWIHRPTHGYTDELGFGESPRQAWADAARRIK